MVKFGQTLNFHCWIKAKEQVFQISISSNQERVFQVIHAKLKPRSKYFQVIITNFFSVINETEEKRQEGRRSGEHGGPLSCVYVAMTRLCSLRTGESLAGRGCGGCRRRFHCTCGSHFLFCQTTPRAKAASGACREQRVPRGVGWWEQKGKFIPCYFCTNPLMFSAQVKRRPDLESLSFVGQPIFLFFLLSFPYTHRSICCGVYAFSSIQTLEQKFMLCTCVRQFIVLAMKTISVQLLKNNSIGTYSLIITKQV